jgi:hypothetical protein
LPLFSRELSFALTLIAPSKALIKFLSIKILKIVIFEKVYETKTLHVAKKIAFWYKKNLKMKNKIFHWFFFFP